jgi:hypothetical protein
MRVPVSFQLIDGTVIPAGTPAITNESGLFWAEMVVEFIDLISPPQTLFTVSKDEAQNIPALSDIIKWDTLEAMDGWWDWANDLTATYMTSEGTQPFSLPAGSSWATEGGQVYDWFSDLIFDAAASPTEKKLSVDVGGAAHDWFDLRESLREPTKPLRSRQGVPCRQNPRALSRVSREGRVSASGQVTIDYRSTAEAEAAQRFGRKPVGRVLADGDITLTLLFQPARQADAVAVFAEVFAAGTSATECLSQWSGLASEAGRFFTIAAVSTLERNLMPESMMTMHAVQDIVGAP